MAHTDMNEAISSTVLCLSPDYKLLNLKQKHKDELLLTIYDHEGISHSEAAEAIGVSASGLNAIVKKICDECAPEESPLKYTRVNKFKYYRLTDSGRQYVESNLISVKGREYESKLNEYWELYQIRAGGNPESRIDKVLEQYVKLEDIVEENQNLIYSFMDCLLEFYKEMPRNAWDTLERLVRSAKARDKIKNIIIDRCEEMKLFEPLSKMAEEDPEMIYRFAEMVQAHIYGSQNAVTVEPAQGWGVLKPVVQKIESDMFRAMIGLNDKSSIRKLWIGNGMDMHLAYFLAEKYDMLLLKYEQDRGKKRE